MPKFILGKFVPQMKVQEAARLSNLTEAQISLWMQKLEERKESKEDVKSDISPFRSSMRILFSVLIVILDEPRRIDSLQTEQLLHE